MQHNYPSMSGSIYDMKLKFALGITRFEVMAIGDTVGWVTGVTGV